MKLQLGPIIGHVEPSRARIWVQTDEPGVVRLRVFRDPAHHQEVGIGFEALAQDNQGRTATVIAHGLDADTRYFYQLEDELGNSLLADDNDRSFRTAPAPTTVSTFRFGVASCHKFEVGQFAMWKRMKDVFAATDVRFLMLCGDQIYADEAYRQMAKHRRPQHDEVVAAYRRAYEQQWAVPEMMRVLGTMPTYMIWDDHDINNGWGAHKLDASSIKRQAIFAGARQAYNEFQHVHNPHTFGHGRHYYAFRHGATGFVVLDSRGQRDSNRKQDPVLGSQQLRDIKGWVAGQASTLNALFVVVSVPVAHTPSFVANLIPKSDLRDQWSYKPNKPERRSLVRFLFDVANQHDLPVALISGDVHVGAFARFHSTRPAHRRRPMLYQMTSSPISNRPSHRITDLQFAIDRVRRIDDKIKARILDVFGARNFGIIEVAVSATAETTLRFELYEETADGAGLEQPHIRETA